MSQTDNDTARLDNTPSDALEDGDADVLDTPQTDDPETLRAELDAVSRRAEEMSEAFLRSRADFANYKRRNEEERESLRSVMNTDLLTRLLPIVDNFERALHASAQTQDYDKLVGGVNAVYRQIQDLLAREGVTAIEAEGEPFDPNFHNAVLREETTEYPENSVIEELQKGYVLNGKVLRPTLVKVAAGDE
ncbi:MAG: nucleotide exchange factor GrpE [Armatimonadota bacterium]